MANACGSSLGWKRHLYFAARQSSGWLSIKAKVGNQTVSVCWELTQPFYNSNVGWTVQCWAQPGRLVVFSQSCPTPCNSMDCNKPGFPVLHYLLTLFKLMSIESMMPSNHLILCCPHLLLPSSFPSIRDFLSESAVRIDDQNTGASAKIIGWLRCTYFETFTIDQVLTSNPHLFCSHSCYWWHYINTFFHFSAQQYTGPRNVT